MSFLNKTFLYAYAGAVCAALLLTPAFAHASDSELTDRVVIQKFIDGATYQLTDGRVVRLIGVNPENTAGAQKVLEGAGLTAVHLEFDKQRSDEEGHTLAYVFADLFCHGGPGSELVHGERVDHFMPHPATIFLNEALIEAGYADFVSQPPNIHYDKRLRAARDAAAAAGRGLWKNREEVKNGLVEEHFPDGTVSARVPYAYGMKNGTAHWYHMNGKSAGGCRYINDKEDGRCVWFYENGKKKEEDNYSYGVRQGAHLQWYENGRLALKGVMKNNKYDGVLVYWDKKGRVIAKGRYREGVPYDGTFIRHLKGNIDKRVTYRKGEMTGEEEIDWDGLQEGLDGAPEQSGGDHEE